MKNILFASILAAASISQAAEEHTQVLLAPVEAGKTDQFDWGVVIKADAVRGKGSTADRGGLKVDLDLAKYLQEGYAIYSITKLQSGLPNSDALMFILVRPKK